jgi:hypothetical protein
VVEDILRASQSALSHLQFQDVIAQDLRQLDGQARQAQIEALQVLDADASVLAEIPEAEYTTVGGTMAGPNVATSGDVLMF